MKLKRKILNTIWPKGSFQQIVRGPMKGMQYKISSLGWSPIFGLWEPEYQSLFRKLIGKNWTIFDLGANVGIHTMLFSRLSGPEGKIIAFEPIQVNIDEMNFNFERNNLKNIKIEPIAITNYSGKVAFQIGEHDGQGGINGIGKRTGETLEVTCITLDEYIEINNLTPDMIKIDIEGEEGNALSGFKLLSKIKPVLIVELHTPEQDVKVGNILLENEYMAFRISDNSGKNKIDLNNLKKIERLDLPYPNPNGIWGTILAFHQSNINKFNFLTV